MADRAQDGVRDARRVILDRIRRAQRREGTGPSPGEREAVEACIAARQRGPLPPLAGDGIALFRERAESLSSSTDTVAGLAAVPAAVRRYLDAHGLPRRGCVWPALRALDWASAGLELAPRRAAADDPVGVTGVFAAVAETGTLMLVSGRETPATVSLLPETHVAVVPASRVVPYMEDAWDMARAAFGELPRSVNFVSGPSRTGDIEQKMVLGAHGPYRVHIVVVTGA